MISDIHKTSPWPSLVGAADFSGTSCEIPTCLTFLERREGLDLYALRTGELGMCVSLDGSTGYVKDIYLIRYSMFAAMFKAVDMVRISSPGVKHYNLRDEDLIEALVLLGCSERLKIEQLSAEFFGRPIEINYQGQSINSDGEMKALKRGSYMFYKGLSSYSVHFWRAQKKARVIACREMRALPRLSSKTYGFWVDLDKISPSVAQVFPEFMPYFMTCKRKESQSSYVMVSKKGFPEAVVSFPTKTSSKREVEALGYGLLRYQSQNAPEEMVTPVTDLLCNRMPELDIEDIIPVARKIVKAPEMKSSLVEVAMSRPDTSGLRASVPNNMPRQLFDTFFPKPRKTPRTGFKSSNR